MSLNDIDKLSDPHESPANPSGTRPPKSSGTRVVLLRAKHFPLLVFFGAVLVALAFWAKFPAEFANPENEDFLGYYGPVAENIVHGHGITLDGKVAVDYPPGFAILVAAVYLPAHLLHIPEQTALHVAFVLLFALGALLIYSLARMIWSPRRALVAPLVWACYPLILWTIKMPTTELPFSVVLYAALLLFAKAWKREERSDHLFLLAGIVTGFAMLVRPIAIGAGAVMALLVLFRTTSRWRRRVIICSLLMAGNLLAILPWEVHAYSKIHKAIPLCVGAHAIMFGTFDGLTFAVWNPEGFRRGVALPADVRSFMERTVAKYDLGKSSDREMWRFIGNEVRERPVTFAKLMTIKAARSFYGTNSNRNERPAMVVNAAFLLLMLYSALRIWRNRPESRFLVAIVLVPFVYFWGMTIMVVSIVRYMTPVLGATAVFFPALLGRRRREE